MTRTTRTRAVALAALAAVLLPVLATAVLIWSFADRADAVDRIPAAIVNEDEIVRGDTPMAAGRALSSALIHPEDGTTSLDWRLTSAEDAEQGLADGTYDAVLTIQESFSADVLSSGGDDPRTAQLVLETDPASSTVGAVASRAVADGAAQSLGDQVTEAYLTQVYAGMDDLSGALTEATAGASDLTDGLDALSSGADSVAQGASSLAEGAGTLGTGTASVSAGAASLAGGAQDLSGGAASLAAGTGDLAAAAASVDSAAGSLATGSQSLASSLAALSEACPPVPGSEPFCAQLDATARAAATVASGGADLAAGTAGLSAGAAGVDDAAGQVASGAAGLASGAADLATGASEAAGGAAQLGSGAADLASGADEVAAGAATAATSSRSLADGLASGAAQVPAVGGDDAERLADVVTEPVAVSEIAGSEADGWLAATVTAVVLWLGAVTVALVGRRPGRRELDAPVRTRRLVRRVLAPRALVAAVATLACTATLAVGGASVAEPLPFAGLALLGGLAFTLLASGAVTALPRAGVPALAVLTVLEIAAVGGLVPLETAPAPLAALHGLLPLGAFADAAAALATGGAGGSGVALGTDLAVLVAWGAAGLALAAAGIRRQRLVPVPVVPAVPAPRPPVLTPAA
ncbi:YhgE/Pip family protein [Cellulomonas sp. ES6]|uniref:YhgE/Pip domain-containing protein n=1 Tax=Cellulomonas sp. ES6 TaxID=3039384 RepID=UPI0024B7A9A7|nr:YhgE/Pip family protein [Cellulomonas sp. ES6]WHP16218.1 YhgE/Pip family protein [Cellulomonas sp. ES6]